MVKHPVVLGFALLCCITLLAQTQTPTVTGDRSTPLQPLAGEGNIGIRNAVLRDQAEVRVLRVVVEPGGTRIMHSHDDVKFHMFTPITGPMRLDVEGEQPTTVQPWQPFYMKAGTRHGFHNSASSPVEIMEVFVK